MRSNRPYVQIDPDVLEQARQIDLLFYLRAYEPSNLVKVKGTTNVYCTAEHDSLKISNGKWYWGERFQVIVATHLNTECLHNHFVVNSVSYIDGKHYHDNKKNLRLLRQRSDELCREYSLSVIEHPSGRKKPYVLCQAEKNGLPTRDTVARQAVDEAISKSFTLKDFDRQLSEMGYRINFDPNRKYWTIIGKEKIQSSIATQVRNLREADETIKKYIQDDITALSDELAQAERIIAKLEQAHQGQQDLMKGLSEVKKTLLNFNSLVADMEYEDKLSLLTTLIERIIVAPNDTEEICHIFIKGCSNEEYDDFFRESEDEMCDLDRYSKLYSYVCRNPVKA